MVDIDREPPGSGSDRGAGAIVGDTVRGPGRGSPAGAEPRADIMMLV